MGSKEELEGLGRVFESFFIVEGGGGEWKGDFNS